MAGSRDLAGPPFRVHISFTPHAEDDAINFSPRRWQQMNGRAIVSFVVGLIVVGILAGVGVGIYQAGLAQGVIDAGRLPAGAVVPVAGYGYGYGFHGFGFLGLLFPILFLFLIFGLVRAAFGR